MEYKQNSIGNIIHEINFPAMTKQNAVMAKSKIAGSATNFTYIQGGPLWFATLCICSGALLAVFVYAILYHFILYKKRCTYPVTFDTRLNTIRIIGITRDEDGHECDNEKDIEERHDATRTAAKRMVPIWSCVAFLACLGLLSNHSLLRVLYSYKKEMQDRLFPTIIQICCSAFALVASTFAVLNYKMCSKTYPVSNTDISWVGNFILYKLQFETVWSLHLVTNVIFFEDILVLVSVSSYDPVLKDGITLATMIYIWQVIFVLYIICFFVLDAWSNEEHLIQPYILMGILLCEITARNYKAMDQDAAYLGTSIIQLLIFVCLTSGVVIRCSRNGIPIVHNFKSV